MRLFKTFPIVLSLAVVIAASAAADPGRGRGHDKGHDKGYQQRHVGAGCPPGLAKKSPSCVPPGQARKYGAARVGEVFRVGDYVLIRDPRRYDLERRSNWSYYRDDDRIYRVDRNTQKVLAVMDLIRAFSN